MNSIIEIIKKVDRGLARVETWLIVFVVAAMLLLTTTHVILKLVGAPMIQLEEAARFLVIWVGFAGGAVAAHQGRHINVDILTRFLHGWWGRVIMTVVWIIGAVMTLVLLQNAISYVFTSEQSLLKDGDIAISFTFGEKTIGIPGWTAASIIPIGLALIAIHMLFSAVYAATGHISPGREEQAAQKQGAMSAPVKEDANETVHAGEGGAS
ncbi:MAG TPA: TRAP transporter small permease subunit [Myxococcota bacterium]|nr:TRAP transporter small permease subunit [Myxococcota bacterium]